MEQHVDYSQSTPLIVLWLLVAALSIFAVVRFSMDSGVPAQGGDGVYTAEAEGYGGPVKVQITVSGGVMTDVQITGERETKSKGGVAMEQMPAQLLEAQSPEVEGVSGATVTGDAIRAAVADAMAQAGLDARPKV